MMNENNWNLAFSKLDRRIIRFLIIFLKIVFIIMLSISSIAFFSKIDLFVIIIDIFIVLIGIFIRKIEKHVLMRVEIINGIIYKTNKYNHKKEIGSISEITSMKRNFLGISVLKGKKILFSFSLRDHNDSKSFYKYLTHNFMDKQYPSQTDIKITSYKRYNIFSHVFLILDCLFFSTLLLLSVILYNWPLIAKLFYFLFAILWLYTIFDEIYYILYTAFKLKPCSFNIKKDQVSFSILKVSQSTKRRFNPTYSASSPPSRYSKGYKGILIKEDVCLQYADIVNVDFVVNLDMTIPNSYLTHAYFYYRKGLDIVIVTKERNYFILSDLFSCNDIEIIYRELRGRIKDTNF